MGAGSAAIAAAAKQAVTSTMQQHQGRRGAQASFKASVATAMKAEQLSEIFLFLFSFSIFYLCNNNITLEILLSNLQPDCLSCLCQCAICISALNCKVLNFIKLLKVLNFKLITSFIL